MLLVLDLQSSSSSNASFVALMGANALATDKTTSMSSENQKHDNDYNIKYA